MAPNAAGIVTRPDAALSMDLSGNFAVSARVVGGQTVIAFEVTK